jgi:hypothetical protein
VARWSSIQQAIEPEATRTKLRTLGNAIPPRLILNGGIPMDLLLILIVILLLFGGGGYWARRRYW